MAIYRRSYTQLDRDSLFTPQSFMRGRTRGRMRMSGLFDDIFGVNSDPVGTDVPDTSGGSGFDWNQAIGDLGNLYQTYTQAQLTKDLYETNLQRQAQGLAPISAEQVAPQVSVGVSSGTQRTILLAVLGGAGILGAAYAFGMVGKGKRRR